tara:strand:- start:2264 stop:2974 length:711 start_codon:yes stop_codon:yes gene_type:complete
VSTEKSCYLSIILPAYNEENGLEKCVNETIKTVNSENISYEIIIVENGSTDNTYKIAQQISKNFNFISVVHLEEPGFENAIRNGFKLAKGELVAHLDVDLSTDMSHFKELLSHAKNYDFVTGSRYLDLSSAKRTFGRLFLSKAFNSLLINFLLKSKIKDNNCGFRIIKKNVGLELLNFVDSNTGFGNVEIIVIAQRKGYSVKEFPVKWTENMSDIKFKWVSEFLIPALRLWRRLNF